MAAKSERVYDELISFLGDPMFQIPVRTFMDENCLIFDPTIDEGADHKGIHAKYKKLIDALLEGFCQDAKITVDEAIQGVNKLREIPDVKDVFNTLFEQVLAATDYDVFSQVMMKRNIMIQEQVLVMMIAMTGGLPESLLGANIAMTAGGRSPQRGPSAPTQQHTSLDKQEEQILQKVMQSSKSDHDRSKQREKMSEAELKNTLELSKHEATVLKEERHKMEESMKTLTLGDPSSRSAPSAKLQQPVQLPPSLAVASKPMSGSEAASQWLAEAQSTVGHSSTHNALAASLSKLSPEELKKRQEFLREQRDKLLAKKKEEREKQLGAELGSKPQRPQSARAARAAMANDAAAGAKAAEDERKMAMRRAIAAKLKQEVIGKQ